MKGIGGNYGKKMTIVEKYEAIIGKVEGVLSAEEIAFLKESRTPRKEKCKSQTHQSTGRE